MQRRRRSSTRIPFTLPLSPPWGIHRRKTLEGGKGRLPSDVILQFGSGLGKCCGHLMLIKRLLMSFDEELAAVTELSPTSMATQLMLPTNGQEVILHIYLCGN